MMLLQPAFFFLMSLTLFCGSAGAQQAAFTGNWKIDLRTPEERRQKVECGEAYFQLEQIGERVSGEHGLATAGCSRLNEGGKNTVKGVATGRTAILVVTSGRNGAIVLGRAARIGNKLQWTTLDEIKPGEPAGDPALILGNGLLLRE